MAGAALAAGLTVAPAGAAPGRPTGPTAPAAPVATPTGALTAQPRSTTFARQVLRVLRQQEPSTAEVVALGRKLDAANTPATLRTAALATPQVQARVGQLFGQLLDRAPDPGGLAYWTARVHDGRLSYENLVVALTISDEAFAAAGGSKAGYVDWVYVHVLGRPADTAGRAYWLARLEGGTSRDRFTRSFLRSTERARALVRAGFLQVLDRPADSGGLSYWVRRYAAAQVGELDLVVALLASAESRGSGCGYDAHECLFPFPSDRFATHDGTTRTGRRIGFKPEWMPTNKAGTHIDPTEWNRNDGFSVGQALVTRVPGIDLGQTGAAPLDDIGASLDPGAPIVLWDLDAGARVPYFAELDANVAGGSADQALYVRPAVNYTAGHRYAVALRGLKTATGTAIAPNPRFAAELARIGAPGGADPDTYDRDLADALDALHDEAGVDVDGTLHEAWTFTVASVENTTGRATHIRDEALDTLGAGGAPAFTVGTVTPNPRTGVLKRIEGTFQVPLYLTGDGAAGQGFTAGADGLPDRNGTFTANYDCEIPTSATTTAARATVYGHGLFGDLGEVRSGSQAAMVADHGMAYCATDWIGMAEGDLGNALTILQDLSTFRTLPDRSQQGILNTIFLGRLLTSEAGFVADPAFRAGGQPLIDTSDLFYDGNSQGAVIGGAYVALSPDTSAGVLGVPGMDYATLLERSVDFTVFNDVMKTTYPNVLDRVVGLQLLQMLWDRGETNGYAAHLASDRLPGSSPSARVLLHAALGDHQVATLTAEVEARTAGMAVHRPAYGPGRSPDVEPAWGLPSIDYPSSGSGLVIWDSGAVLAPLANVPPSDATPDPHGDPRSSALAQQQKSTFLATGGTIVDVCSAAVCTAPAT